MPQQLGIFQQWWGGEWADRAIINQNATELAFVEGDVSNLQAQVKKQAQEILWLRAMFMGVVEVLHAKTPFDDAELEAAVKKAWTALTAPPPPPPPQLSAQPAHPAVQQLVTCPRCQRAVPVTRTIITANGTVCDACA